MKPQRTDAPASKAASDEAIQILDYWRVLERRKGVIVVTTLLCVTLAAIYTLLVTPQYRASATVQIERHQPDILDFKDVLGVDASGYQDFYQTQYKILQSRAVLRMAVDRSDLMNRPEFAGRKRSPAQRLVRWARSVVSIDDDALPAGDDNRAMEFLAQRLTIQPLSRSHLVRVSVTDRDAELARDLANVVIEAYQQFGLDARYSATAQASEFLTKQVAQLQTEISKMERKLQEYGVEKELLTRPDDTQDISSQALDGLNTRLVQAKGSLAVAEAQYLSLRDAPPNALPEVLNSPLVSRLKQQYAEIERHHSQMSERFQNDWPAMRELDEELKKAQERLELEVQLIATQVRSVAEADYNRAQAEVIAIARQLEQQKREVQRVGRDAIEYASLAAQIKTKRAFLGDLLNRQSQTVVSDRLRGTRASNIRVVDRAETPRKPVTPRKLFNLVVSVFLGLLGGVGGAVLLDHLDYTVKNEQEIRRLTDLPVLGHVALFRPLQAVGDAGADEVASKLDPVDLGTHLDPRSSFAECFKNLRTALLLASPDRPPRHIIITSAEPGDGKSTVSVNLAIALTQMGRRVLLVDADLRRPRLHKVLGLPNDVGLSSFLTGNAGVEELLQPCAVPELRVITSGPIPPTPSELLGSSSLQGLLVRLAEQYRLDHVILDSAPSVQVADSVILASSADATLLVVRAEKTSRESLTQAVSRLRHARAHLVGTVLNGFADQTGYFYGRYHSDGGEEHGKPRSGGKRDLRRQRAGTA